MYVQLEAQTHSQTQTQINSRKTQCHISFKLTQCIHVIIVIVKVKACGALIVMLKAVTVLQ